MGRQTSSSSRAVGSASGSGRSSFNTDGKSQRVTSSMSNAHGGAPTGPSIGGRRNKTSSNTFTRIIIEDSGSSNSDASDESESSSDGDGSSSSGSDDEDDEYEVKSILGLRESQGELKYHIEWKGYPIEEATWEPEANVFAGQNIGMIVGRFFKKNPDAAKLATEHTRSDVCRSKANQILSRVVASGAKRKVSSRRNQEREERKQSGGHAEGGRAAAQQEQTRRRKLHGVEIETSEKEDEDAATETVSAASTVLPVAELTREVPGDAEGWVTVPKDIVEGRKGIGQQTQRKKGRGDSNVALRAGKEGNAAGKKKRSPAAPINGDLVVIERDPQPRGTKTPKKRRATTSAPASSAEGDSSSRGVAVVPPRRSGDIAMFDIQNEALDGGADWMTTSRLSPHYKQFLQASRPQKSVLNIRTEKSPVRKKPKVSTSSYKSASTTDPSGADVHNVLKTKTADSASVQEKKHVRLADKPMVAQRKEEKLAGTALTSAASTNHLNGMHDSPSTPPLTLSQSSMNAMDPLNIEMDTANEVDDNHNQPHRRSDNDDAGSSDADTDDEEPIGLIATEDKLNVCVEEDSPSIMNTTVNIDEDVPSMSNTVDVDGDLSPPTDSSDSKTLDGQGKDVRAIDVNFTDFLSSSSSHTSQHRHRQEDEVMTGNASQYRGRIPKWASNKESHIQPRSAPRVTKAVFAPTSNETAGLHVNINSSGGVMGAMQPVVARGSAALDSGIECQPTAPGRASASATPSSSDPRKPKSGRIPNWGQRKGTNARPPPKSTGLPISGMSDALKTIATSNTSTPASEYLPRTIASAATPMLPQGIKEKNGEKNGKLLDVDNDQADICVIVDDDNGDNADNVGVIGDGRPGSLGSGMQTNTAIAATNATRTTCKTATGRPQTTLEVLSQEGDTTSDEGSDDESSSSTTSSSSADSSSVVESGHHDVVTSETTSVDTSAHQNTAEPLSGQSVGEASTTESFFEQQRGKMREALDDAAEASDVESILREIHEQAKKANRSDNRDVVVHLARVLVDGVSRARASKHHGTPLLAPSAAVSWLFKIVRLAPFEVSVSKAVIKELRTMHDAPKKSGKIEEFVHLLRLLLYVFSFHCGDESFKDLWLCLVYNLHIGGSRQILIPDVALDLLEAAAASLNKPSFLWKAPSTDLGKLDAQLRGGSTMAALKCNKKTARAKHETQTCSEVFIGLHRLSVSTVTLHQSLLVSSSGSGRPSSSSGGGSNHVEGGRKHCDRLITDVARMIKSLQAAARKRNLAWLLNKPLQHMATDILWDVYNIVGTDLGGSALCVGVSELFEAEGESQKALKHLRGVLKVHMHQRNLEARFMADPALLLQYLWVEFRASPKPDGQIVKKMIDQLRRGIRFRNDLLLSEPATTNLEARTEEERRVLILYKGLCHAHDYFQFELRSIEHLISQVSDKFRSSAGHDFVREARATYADHIDTGKNSRRQLGRIPPHQPPIGYPGQSSSASVRPKIVVPPVPVSPFAAPNGNS